MLGYHYGQNTGLLNNHSLAGYIDEETDRVILHISNSNHDQFMMALSYAENFIQQNRQNAKSNIEVVAHAGGIDLMRENSPLAARVSALMQAYENIHFVACANAISNLRQSDIEPLIIANVGTEKPAMDHIIERVQAGWRYVKIESIMKI